MTNKQRAYLSSLAADMSPILQIGKASLTPEYTNAVDEALEARELIKINVLKNCFDDPKEIACVAARTCSPPCWARSRWSLGGRTRIV